MVAPSVEGRQVTQAENDEFLELARRIADRSADPDAAYESFLLGLEMGLARGSIQPVVSAKVEAVTERADRAEEDRIIPDPRKPMIRKVQRARYASTADFPTEWTLDH